MDNKVAFQKIMDSELDKTCKKINTKLDVAVITKRTFLKATGNAAVKTMHYYELMGVPSSFVSGISSFLVTELLKELYGADGSVTED